MGVFGQNTLGHQSLTHLATGRELRVDIDARPQTHTANGKNTLAHQLLQALMEVLA